MLIQVYSLVLFRRSAEKMNFFAILDAELFLQMQIKGQLIKANSIVTYCTKFVLLLSGASYLISKNDLFDFEISLLFEIKLEDILKQKEIVSFFDQKEKHENLICSIILGIFIS